uniref:L-gulonate 3-dehydrogenase n=1 Tax=Syphacia muris TaxID=451379 RepID=A0A0N5B090_9BILA
MDIKLNLKESVAENIEDKRRIFKKLDSMISKDTIVGSSTSAIPSSTFVKNLQNQSQYLVVHPINPPLLVRLVEVVPNQWTSTEVVKSVINIIEGLGQKPIQVRKEVPGFALNRIQYAIIEESWRLVQSGVLTPEDVDTVVKEGLGCRYAFYGPFEVMHLNANGIDDYMQRYMGGVGQVISDFGPHPSFNEPEVKQLLSNSLNSRMSVSELSQFLREREKNLAELAKLKLKKD